MNGIATLEVPGSAHVLHCERDEHGRLVRISSGDSVYFTDDGAGVRTYGDLAVVREMALTRGLLRHVDACGESWLEEYAWDELLRPLLVDGVRIERDERYRVVACRGDETWRYGYAGDQLVVIDSPRGTRYLTRGSSGRPVILRERDGAEEIRYDDEGVRVDVTPLPSTWHRDPLGRLISVCDAGGRVLHTWLWDGFACLGRIDGEPGEPLAACFSLDPSCTPVRVITRDGATRIPRDAYGEGLLAHRGVPGLYGGAIHEGFVHLRSRAVDPRCGSFDRLDPLHGREDDPRREDGYAGPLLIETAECGPYAVSQYDPVGRADPTGELDFGMVMLDLTWSMQNNLAGWFGLDWSIGWWTDFFVSIGQIFAYMAGNRGEAYLKRFFDYEGLTNDRTGHWAIRRGFFGNDRAFTFQHLLVSSHESFEQLELTNVIDPKGAFAPTLYRTILRAAPTGGTPFLLRGNGDATLVQWTRHGGPAVAVSPGSAVPRFPSGGIHLAQTRSDRGPLACSVTELVPSGAPVTATLAATEVVTTVPLPTPLVAGTIVVLTDVGRNAEIKTVLDVRAALVRFQEPATALAPANVTIQPLNAPPAAEPAPVSAVAAVPGRLSTAGTTLNYAPNDALQLSQGGAIVGAIVIQGFETAITIDGALAALVAPVSVFTAAPGAFTAGALAGNALTTTGAAPNGPIALTGNGQSVGAFATQTSPTTSQLDRVLDVIVGPTPQWAPLNASPAPIGTAAAIGAATTLTYTPVAIRTAPAVNSFIVLTDSAGTPVTTARAVTAVQYDALVSASSTLPPNVAAPYQVALFTPSGPAIVNRTLSAQIGLTVAGGAALTGTSLEIFSMPSPVLTAGNSTLVNAGGTVTAAGVMTLSAAQAALFAPSQLVILGNGATFQTNVVARLTTTVTLDRQVTFTNGAVIDAVPLAANGPVWNATFVNATTITVQPTVGAAFVQLPRFEVGAFVLVTPVGNPAIQLRVSAVTGTTLTLTEGPPVPNAALTVQLIVPVNPAPVNDTWRIGLRGAISGGTVNANNTTTTNTITIDIWNTLHWAAGALLGLVEVDGAGLPLAPHIAAVQNTTYTVTFVSPPSIVNNLTVTTVTTPPFYAGTFSQSGPDLTLNDTAGTAPAGTNLLIAVPYAPAATPIAAPAGELGSGTVLVPDEVKWDIDRKKSLVFHELTHTRQAMHSGPLFWGYIPIFALEGLAEWKTDVGMPEFTRYISATVESVNGAFALEAPDASRIELKEGSMVQLSMTGAAPALVKLGKPTGTKFPLTGSSFSAGPAQVRRNASKASSIIDGFLSAFHTISLGGIANLGVGATWGSVIRLFGHLGYIISHRLFHSGTAYPATVDDATHITMKDDDGRRAMQGFRNIFLTAKDVTEMYDIESIDDAKITLKKATPFTGDISVKPYNGDDFIDGLDYWTATVPDAAKPAQIQVAQRNGKSIGLQAFDRVSVGAGKSTSRTNVTFATGDLVDLQEPPQTFGANQELRIAKVDERDPIGDADSRILTEMGLGWMRWLLDPYGQIQYRANPSNKYLNAFTRIARYAFGNHSWSSFFIGRLFLSDLSHQMFADNDVLGNADPGILSPMEQEAAQESGNLYSVLAKLHGNFAVPDDDNPAQATATIGDIGHYWYSPSWFSGTTFGPQGFSCQPLSPSIPVPGTAGTPLFDASGISFANNIVVVPAIGKETAAVTLNGAIATTSARPGTFVPDVFYPKNVAADPEAATTSGAVPGGYRPGPRGLIPVSPTVELSLGAYVAFNQPGLHRVSVDDGIQDWPAGRAAHNAKSQTILFDVTVSDVQLLLASLPIVRATPPAPFAMIPTQRARLTTPAAGTFAITAMNTNIVTVNNDVLQATAVGNEFVEISRFYNATGVPPVYTDGVLTEHNGVHLPVPIHVPVRMIAVSVVSTLPFLSTNGRGAPVPASVSPGGQGFIVVPANVVFNPTPTNFAYAGAGVPLVNPAPTATPVNPGTLADLAAFQDTGGQAFQINFPANDPPELPVTITFTTTVGTLANQIPITTQILLQPNFTLAGPTTMSVTGGPLTIALTASGGINVATPQVRNGNPAGIAFTPPPAGSVLSITVTGATTPGQRQIIVSDAANPASFATITINVMP
jgi:hypothetical protein